MLMGWLTLQVLVSLTVFGAFAVESTRRGELIDVGAHQALLLGLFAVYSAVVCLIAWLAFYLPVYWYWPREGGGLGRRSFTFVGGACGGLIGVIFFLANTPDAPPFAALAIIAMPMVTGGVAALVGGWREEKERRFLEWQKQVTTPILP
jgi:hypothetical protein